MPFEIPVSWKWCKVDDFAYVASGSTPDKSAFVEKGIPYLKMYNLKNQKIDFDFKPQDIKEEVHNGKLQRSRTEVGDLIMNIVGPPLGKLAIIPSSLPQCNFNQAAVLIRPIVHKEIIVNFLYYYLSEMSEINSLQTRGNAGQDNISLTQCMGVHVPMPPLNEQKRIVAEIEKWFALINDLETDKQELQEAIKKSKMKILDLAIHGKLVEQDPNDEPASELLKHIAPNAALCDNSHYENLPQGWMVCKLEDIVDYEQPTQYLVQSTNYSDNYKTPVLTAGKSFILGYTNETTGIYDKLPAIIFDDFTTDSRFVDFPFKVKSSAMKILQVDKDINIRYVAYFMNITRLVGDTHKRYWISEYSKIPIPLPPIKEQNRIVQAIQDIEAKLNEITAEL